MSTIGKLTLASATVVMLVAGCAQSAPNPEDEARRAGLLPAPIAQREHPVANPITNPILRDMRAALADPERLPVLALPENKDYSYLLDDLKNKGRYNGFNTDRIDATTFDSLTESLNGIYARMGPELAKDFDTLIKVVVLNTPRSPMVAQKATTGGQVSDDELLQIAQSFLHNKTPLQVAELAETLQANQQRKPGAIQ